MVESLADADYGIVLWEVDERPPSLCSFSDDCTAFLQEHVEDEDRAVSIPTTVIVELNLERSWILGRLEVAGFERCEDPRSMRA